MALLTQRERQWAGNQFGTGMLTTEDVARAYMVSDIQKIHHELRTLADVADGFQGGVSPQAVRDEAERLDRVNEDTCRRIETLRNQLDVTINLVPAKEPWCLLDRLDRDLRQLKTDLGFPLAGLGANSSKAVR